MDEFDPIKLRVVESMTFAYTAETMRHVMAEVDRLLAVLEPMFMLSIADRLETVGGPHALIDSLRTEGQERQKRAAADTGPLPQRTPGHSLHEANTTTSSNLFESGETQ